MSCNKPKKRMDKKTAFSMSGDAKKERRSTRKTRAGVDAMTRFKAAGGSVTALVRVRRRLMMPTTSGARRRDSNFGL